VGARQAAQIGVDKDFKDCAGVSFRSVDYAVAGGVPSTAVKPRSSAVKERKTGITYAKAEQERQTFRQECRRKGGRATLRRGARPVRRERLQGAAGFPALDAA